MLTLFTDTDCDITPVLAAEHNYHIISMPYTIGETLVCPWEDYATFDSHAFYDQLRAGTVPHTSSVNTDRYVEYFEPVFAAGSDILYVHFSSSMSSTFNNMNMALEELKTRYPERKLYTVDTLSSANCALNILLEIGDLVQGGASVEEILAWADREVQHFAGMCFVDNLTYLVRGGRLSKGSGAIGNLLGIRPIIVSTPEGTLENIDKVRGRRHAVGRLVQYMQEVGRDLDSHRVIISHTDAPEMAAELAAEITETFGISDEQIMTIELNPTVGCHLGPDAVSLSFYAEHR